MAFDAVNEFNDVITVWSSYEPVFDSICPTLCSNDDVVECIFVMLISLEAVYVLSDVVESDEEINPKSVICFEPLIVPAGVLSVSYTHLRAHETV